MEHNLPFEASNHAGPLFRKMFPDSEIAQKYGCAATKTAAIVNYALAPEMLAPVVDYLKTEPLVYVLMEVLTPGLKIFIPLLYAYLT